MNAEVYCLDELFILGGLTRQDYPFIVAGCTKLGHNGDLFSDIADRCREIYIPYGCSPRLLDELIARPLRWYRSNLMIAACTIHVPQTEIITGGVLGDPSSPPRAADGGEVDKAGDWRIITFPGGPGIAYEPVGTENVGFASLDRRLGGKELLMAISEEAYKKDIQRLIAITDGSGAGAQGGAIIRSGRDYIEWSLAELV